MTEREELGPNDVAKITDALDGRIALAAAEGRACDDLVQAVIMLRKAAALRSPSVEEVARVIFMEVDDLYYAPTDPDCLKVAQAIAALYGRRE